MAYLTHNAWSHTVSYWGGIRQELKASLPVSCAEGEEAQTFLLLAIFPHSYSRPGVGLLTSVNNQDDPPQTCSRASLISIIPH